MPLPLYLRQWINDRYLPKIKEERDPMWRQVFIKCKVHVLNPKNWIEQKDGSTECTTPMWDFYLEECNETNPPDNK